MWGAWTNGPYSTTLVITNNKNDNNTIPFLTLYKIQKYLFGVFECVCVLTSVVYCTTFLSILLSHGLWFVKKLWANKLKNDFAFWKLTPNFPVDLKMITMIFNILLLKWCSGLPVIDFVVCVLSYHFPCDWTWIWLTRIETDMYIELIDWLSHPSLPFNSFQGKWILHNSFSGKSILLAKLIQNYHFKKMLHRWW